MTEDRFATEPALWRSVGRGAALGLAIGIAIELIALLGHSETAPVLVLGVPIAVLALLQLVRASITETPPPDPVTEPRPTVVRTEYFARLRQLERRLDSASTDPYKFEWSIRPMLAQLAAERLDHKHGISFHRESARAREVVGEQLWQIMTTSDTPIQPVNPARLRELVQAISRI
jgi:hypothetical protein